MQSEGHGQREECHVKNIFQIDEGVPKQEWLRQEKQDDCRGRHSGHVSFGQVEDGEGADEEGGEVNKVPSIRAIRSW